MANCPRRRERGWSVSDFKGRRFGGEIVPRAVRLIRPVRGLDTLKTACATIEGFEATLDMSRRSGAQPR